MCSVNPARIGSKRPLRRSRQTKHQCYLVWLHAGKDLTHPGPTLETVIIPQLLFAPPHPLIEARKQLLPNPEKDWFREISLLDMLLHLKQGAGRLVRSMTDKGVITILSPRPLTKATGRKIIDTLPPGRLIRNPAGALEFLKESNFNE